MDTRPFCHAVGPVSIPGAEAMPTRGKRDVKLRPSNPFPAHQGTIRMLAFASFENNQGSMKIIYAIKQTAAICGKSIKRSFLEF